MRARYWTAALALTVCSTALYAMDADTFYNKGLALQKRGMTAVFSSDLKVVMNEFQAASKAVKADNEVAKAAGRPIYCAPAKGQKMSSDQLLAEFGQIPASRRKTQTVKAAWREILVRKYPC